MEMVLTQAQLPSRGMFGSLEPNIAEVDIVIVMPYEQFSFQSATGFSNSSPIRSK
jgi:hypothetical protein